MSYGSLITAFACGGLVCLVGFQNATKPLDVDGIRVMQNGEVRWQVLPTDDGARMSFYVKGTERMVMLSGAKVCTIQAMSPDGRWRREISVAEELINDLQILEPEGEAKSEPVFQSWRLARRSGELEIDNTSSVQKAGVSERVTRERAWFLTNVGGKRLQLDLKTGVVNVIASGDRNLGFDVSIGNEAYGLTLEGSVDKGLEVVLRCGKNVYEWKTEKR